MPTAEREAAAAITYFDDFALIGRKPHTKV
jgi:hypothetical protein